MQEIQAPGKPPSELRSMGRAGVWLIVVSCALAAGAGVFLLSSIWVAVVFLLLCGLAIYQALRVSSAVSGKTYSANPAAGYWQDWLAGWYWQTDAEHRLVLLKPDQDVAAHWLLAQRLTRFQGPVWSCWPTPLECERAQAALAMLEMRLKAGLPVDIDGLPWPTGDAVAEGDGAPSSCRLQGMPRVDAAGGFLGFEGVLRPQVQVASSPNAASPTEPSSPDHEDPQACAAAAQLSHNAMTESEQEVLRYALSHDLRAPLRVVDGFSRILKEDYGRVLDRLGNDHLDRVLAATARMNGMIDAILAQAQLSQAPIERSIIDLSALAQDVAQEQQAARRSSLEGSGQGLAVEWVIAEGLTALGDPLLVRRVLDNLIGNALKYSGKVAHPRIEIGRVPATDPTVYFVRDNGAGFDMQHADKLFGLFQRLHSTKEFPGTGVGLAGVQNIVRRHGGRVWAEAVPGEGACFYFTLTGAGTALPDRTARSAQ